MSRSSCDGAAPAAPSTHPQVQGSQQRRHRSQQWDHRDPPPRRPKLPQNRQLPTMNALGRRKTHPRGYPMSRQGTIRGAGSVTPTTTPMAWVVNHPNIQRLWTDEGLGVRKRRRRKRTGTTTGTSADAPFSGALQTQTSPIVPSQGGIRRSRTGPQRSGHRWIPAEVIVGHRPQATPVQRPRQAEADCGMAAPRNSR